MASTAEPAAEDPVLAYTALQAVQTLKETSMPRPALRKRMRRPTLSTAKAKASGTSHAQMVRPPLIAARLLGLVRWD